MLKLNGNISLALGSVVSKKAYLGNTLVYDKTAPPIPISAQTQAILDRADALGYARPSGDKINLIVHFWLTSGFWITQDIIFNFAYNNPLYDNFKTINWRNPNGALLTVNGGMIQKPYGYKGNGIDGYLDTKFNPAVGTNKYKLNNASRGIVVYDNTDSFNADGILDSANNRTYNSMYNASTPNNKINTNFNPNATPIDFVGKGYKLIVRDNSASQRGTSATGTQTSNDASVSLRNGNQTILGTMYFGMSGISFYHMGEALPTSFYADFRTVYNNYLVSIGLNPNA